MTTCIIILNLNQITVIQLSSKPLTKFTVTEPPNYTKLSKKIIPKADDLANLSPYNPLVRENSTDFKPVHITAKIVLSLTLTIISYIKVCSTEYIGVQT
jgi:hypothetical protein